MLTICFFALFWILVGAEQHRWTSDITLGEFPAAISPASIEKCSSEKNIIFIKCDHFPRVAIWNKELISWVEGLNDEGSLFYNKNSYLYQLSFFTIATAMAAQPNPYIIAFLAAAMTLPKHHIHTFIDWSEGLWKDPVWVLLMAVTVFVALATSLMYESHIKKRLTKNFYFYSKVVIKIMYHWALCIPVSWAAMYVLHVIGVFPVRCGTLSPSFLEMTLHLLMLYLGFSKPLLLVLNSIVHGSKFLVGVLQCKH